MRYALGFLGGAIASVVLGAIIVGLGCLLQWAIESIGALATLIIAVVIIGGLFGMSVVWSDDLYP